MHIGTLRTALWDYFLARQNGGQFVIRVEDTDQKRHVAGALESLLGTFQKLGLDYDEGPVLKSDHTVDEMGDYGPYIQSKRLELYRPYAQQLLEAGQAYYCFCSKERLEEMRAAQIAVKQTPKYDRLCLGLSPEVIKERLTAGESHVVRLKIPEGQSTFEDAIRGKISFNNADVDDQVLIKADGFPTYHLAVVVDDHLMNISHVLRGEEWLSSTPKQIILHAMFGWEMPVYAHVPLLLNPDKTKLSKRQGDVSVEDYLAKGYLPQALLNFIATLGYNPKADQEIYTREELSQLFNLSRVNKSGAVLNVEKLNWMNHQYLAKLSPDELLAAAKPFLGDAAQHPRTPKALIVERSRLNVLSEFKAALQSYLETPEFDGKILVWKKTTAENALDELRNVRKFLEQLPEEKFVTVALLEEEVKRYIKDNGRETGNVLWPLRVALSGLAKSASPFEYLWVLGKETSLQRIDRGIERLK